MSAAVARRPPPRQVVDLTVSSSHSSSMLGSGSDSDTSSSDVDMLESPLRVPRHRDHHSHLFNVANECSLVICTVRLKKNHGNAAAKPMTAYDALMHLLDHVQPIAIEFVQKRSTVGAAEAIRALIGPEYRLAPLRAPADVQMPPSLEAALGRPPSSMMQGFANLVVAPTLAFVPKIYGFDAALPCGDASRIIVQRAPSAAYTKVESVEFAMQFLINCIIAARVSPEELRYRIDLLKKIEDSHKPGVQHVLSMPALLSSDEQRAVERHGLYLYVHGSVEPIVQQYQLMAAAAAAPPPTSS